PNDFTHPILPYTVLHIISLYLCRPSHPPTPTLFPYTTLFRSQERFIAYCSSGKVTTCFRSLRLAVKPLHPRILGSGFGLGLQHGRNKDGRHQEERGSGEAKPAQAGPCQNSGLHNTRNFTPPPPQT